MRATRDIFDTRMRRFLAIAVMPATTGCTVLAPALSPDEAGIERATRSHVDISVAAVSNYVFRGVSLSDRRPAVQGSVDFTVESAAGMNANIGIWASSVRFASDAELPRVAGSAPASRHTVRREAGVYGGVGGPLLAGWDWGVQASYYRYPGFSTLDWTELGATLSREFQHTPGRPRVEIQTTKFRNVYLPDGDGKYTGANLKLSLLGDFVIAAQLGKTRYEDQLRGGANYVDRSLTLSRSYRGYQFDLTHTRTNTAQFGVLGDPAVLLGVSRTF